MKQAKTSRRPSRLLSLGLSLVTALGLLAAPGSAAGGSLRAA